MSKQQRGGFVRGYRGPTRRLRVTVVRGRWSVAKDTAVEKMTIRAARFLDVDTARIAGAFYEVADNDGNVIYRQPIEDPTRPSIETFDGGTIRRVDTPDREVTVDVLIPDLPKAALLRIIVRGKELPVGTGKVKGPRKGQTRYKNRANGYQLQGGSKV